MTKLCRDCDYYRGSRMLPQSDFDNKCTHPSQIYLADHVTGSKGYNTARSARSNGIFGFFAGTCGPNAKLFKKAREPKRPPLAP